MAEGQVWEAAEFAGHYKLDNLTVLADVNALGQSEPTMYQHDMEIYRRKFEAEGWAAEVIDGHDVAAVLAALDRAKATKGRPQAIIARTIKGHGFSLVAGKVELARQAVFEGAAGGGDQGDRRSADCGSARSRKILCAATLPEPPDFPAPAAPDYPDGKAGGDARGLRVRAEAAGRGKPADRGDFRRREEFHVLGIFRRRLS